MNSATLQRNSTIGLAFGLSRIWSTTVRNHDALIDPKIYYMKDKYVFHEQSLSESLVREIKRKRKTVEPVIRRRGDWPNA